MTKTNDADYRVGYGRPPKQHQFSPGRSGNPSGRRKGARSFKSDLRDELAELVTVDEAGGSVEITAQRAIVKKLIIMAIQGDAKAIAMVTAFARGLGPDDTEQAEAPEDKAIMEAISGTSNKGHGVSLSAASRTEARNGK